AKLSLVGSLLRSSRQARTETLRGTCLCQIRSEGTVAVTTSTAVSRVYAPPHRVTTSNVMPPNP
ncbi:hypothetical protein A2U01_0098926, partial [Trifolium medium]|nr:hypothetical protein [Trifolium medium]